MARFPPHRIPYSEQDGLWMVFCKVLARLKTPEDIHRFLKDLLNRQERMMFVRRLQIASMLEEGKTYREIMKKLKTSNSTIGRVQRWLEFGRKGYKSAVKELRSLKIEI